MFPSTFPIYILLLFYQVICAHMEDDEYGDSVAICCAFEINDWTVCEKHGILLRIHQVFQTLDVNCELVCELLSRICYRSGHPLTIVGDFVSIDVRTTYECKGIFEFLLRSAKDSRSTNET